MIALDPSFEQLQENMHTLLCVYTQTVMAHVHVFVCPGGQTAETKKVDIVYITSEQDTPGITSGPELRPSNCDTGQLAVHVTSAHFYFACNFACYMYMYM